MAEGEVTSAQENRAALLASLRQRGVQFRLTPAGMQYKDCANALGAQERDWLDVVRAVLTAELRHEAGLCERCGAKTGRGRSGFCIACNKEAGMPHYERLTADKRLQRKSLRNAATVTDLKAADADTSEEFEF